MSHEALSPEAVKKHVRIYIAVFVTLACLTAVTVGVSYLHLPTATAVSVALFIASIKATLVACYFMHLISEKKLIFSVLFITAVFFLVMILIILAASRSMFVI